MKAHRTFKERFYYALKSADVEEDVLQLTDHVSFLDECLPSKLYAWEAYKDGEKSVRYIFNFPPYWGEKECSIPFLPICMVGKRVECTLFFPNCTVGKKSGGYTLSPHLYGRVKVWGAHFFSLDGIALEMVGTQKVKIKHLRC